MLFNKNYIFYFFVACLGADNISANAIDKTYEYADMSDFHYTATLSIKNDNNLFGMLFRIVAGSDIEEEIKSLRTFTEASKTVSNMRSLKDRIESDVVAIYEKTHDLGFYSSDVKYSIEIKDSKHAVVKVAVNTGKLFKLKLNLKYIGKDEAFSKQQSSILNKSLQNYSSAMADVQQLINEAIRNLEEIGYYAPEIIEKRIHLNYERNEAELNLSIKPGNCGVFSFTEVQAFPGISEDFIRNRITWDQGETYNIKKIKETKNNLKSTQIFADVQVEGITSKIVDDKVPILIKVEEDKKHTIDFSLLYSGLRNNNYGTSSSQHKQLKSIVARCSWTRNNAFGNGEKLRVLVEGTPTRVNEKRADYALETYLMKPDVFMKNMYLECVCTKRQELTNVFFKKLDKGSLILNYPLWFFTDVRTGCLLERIYTNGVGSLPEHVDYKSHYENVIIPVEFIINRTDDVLNPTRGYRAFAKFHHICLNNARVRNLEYLDFSFSYNYSLDRSQKTIFAANVSKKFLLGKNIDDIPIDKRIYAGGMNSVRGYANQLASEKVQNYNTHMGGKSSFEFNTELRRRLTQAFGAVVFFDGAKIYGNSSKFEELKTEKKRWFLSYGLGIRYFTSIGPIRVDFAFPIKRRKGVDSKMQFMINLGQAF